ncbi:MAG TPA: hypothetical protein VNO18_11055 [Xanthobacteraceae bacterium]|jgi:hypothetical protein|nr:hypothetical protein [Xanthobacteraceae bacterium]
MTDSIAVLSGALAGLKLMRRALVAVILPGTLFGCLEIPYSSPITPAPIAEVANTTTSATCPGQNFSAFIDAFAESAALQRRYTRMPLKYGHLDAQLIGTPKEDKAFSTRTINSFETIPLFDPKDGGRIFSSKTKRLKQGFEIKIDSNDESTTNRTVVTIFLPDTGFHLQYQFVKTNNCWTLIRIDDRST